MNYKRISVEEAKNILAHETSILVDIRDAESYEEYHVPGAVHLSKDNLPDFLEATPKSTHVVIMCYHGNSSQVVAEYFYEQGYANVYSVDGGFDSWVN